MDEAYIYLALSGIARFFVEQIRVNPRYELFGLNWSMSQTISALIVVVGIIGIFASAKRDKPDYSIPDMSSES